MYTYDILVWAEIYSARLFRWDVFMLDESANKQDVTITPDCAIGEVDPRSKELRIKTIASELLFNYP
jgi:hypothetical protein